MRVEQKAKAINTKRFSRQMQLGDWLIDWVAFARAKQLELDIITAPPAPTHTFYSPHSKPVNSISGIACPIAHHGL